MLAYSSNISHGTAHLKISEFQDRVGTSRMTCNQQFELSGLSLYQLDEAVEFTHLVMDKFNLWMPSLVYNVNLGYRSKLCNYQ